MMDFIIKKDVENKKKRKKQKMKQQEIINLQYFVFQQF